MIRYIIALTIAPVFTTAAIYLCLARIIGLYGPHLSRFAPRTIAITFMVSDLISLVLQAAGGAFASVSEGYNSGRKGANIMIGGLILQVVSLVAFAMVCADFAARCVRGNLVEHDEYSRTRKRLYFKAFLFTIALSTVTIFIRSVYRAAELWSGFSGKLWNDENTFMILDGAMIAIASISLSGLHPGKAFGHLWATTNWSLKRKRSTQQSDSGSSTQLPAKS